MQSTNRPAKFLVPFAQNDSARVEIPATTNDPARFSQSLGSPPLTGMPPEAGGVPPQLEDFNGAINQIARGVWWSLGGGRFAYDATWANDTLIGGYARGAVLPATLGAGSIGMGDWYNNTEANAANPDTDGTGWVPGYHYGSTALTGQTGGTLTLTPAQAAKRIITVAGTLTSNLVLVVPAWVYSWTFINTTGGAFTVTVKNAATAAVVIPQNGAPTPITCDGTQVSLWSPNIAPAVQGTQALQLGQATGRLLRTSIFSRTTFNGPLVVIVDGAAAVTAPTTFTPRSDTRYVRVRAVGGGGGGGGIVALSANTASGGGGGGGGAYSEAMLYTGFSGATITVGTGGAGVSGTNGANGGNTSFGTLVTANGGVGGFPGSAFASSGVVPGTDGAQIAVGTGALFSAGGGNGTPAIVISPSAYCSGAGGSSNIGPGGPGRGGAYGPGGIGAPAPSLGGGGGGAWGNGSGQGPFAGGNGGSGTIAIDEYA